MKGTVSQRSDLWKFCSRFHVSHSWWENNYNPIKFYNGGILLVWNIVAIQCLFVNKTIILWSSCEILYFDRKLISFFFSRPCEHMQLYAGRSWRWNASYRLVGFFKGKAGHNLKRCVPNWIREHWKKHQRVSAMPLSCSSTEIRSCVIGIEAAPHHLALALRATAILLVE